MFGVVGLGFWSLVQGSTRLLWLPPAVATQRWQESPIQLNICLEEPSNPRRPESASRGLKAESREPKRLRHKDAVASKS